jgi:hypothetical protein
MTFFYVVFVIYLLLAIRILIVANFDPHWCLEGWDERSRWYNWSCGRYDFDLFEDDDIGLGTFLIVVPLFTPFIEGLLILSQLKEFVRYLLGKETEDYLDFSSFP